MFSYAFGLIEAAEWITTRRKRQSSARFFSSGTEHTSQEDFFAAKRGQVGRAGFSMHEDFAGWKKGQL
jgi:hypothetical protein